MSAGISKVPCPTKQVVGFPRNTSTSTGNRQRRPVLDLRPQLPRVSLDDLHHVIDVVEIQVLSIDEPISQWSRQHATASGGSDQGKRFELHIDGPRVESLTESDIDPEILHRRVNELLHGRRQSVNLVNEQHRTTPGVGQVGQQVLGSAQGGPRSDLNIDSQFAGEHGRERRLTDSRGAIQKQMRQRVAT